ncbi:MAG: hypothetical protein AB7P03_28570, partial [Kofleriaceae bacterium]
YNLEQTPDPRDLAALVARYCPPELRQTHTHSNPPASLGSANTGGPVTPVIARPGASTTPIARPADPTSPITPSPVAPTAPIVRTITRTPTRERSFATHAALKGILDRADPRPANPLEETAAPSGEASSPPKRTFNPPVLAIAGVWAVVVALAGSIVYFGRSSGSSDRAALISPPPGNTTPATAPAIADAQPPLDVAETVAITIESTPSGAEIYRESDVVKIGVTPYTTSVPRSSTDLRFTLKRAGYTPKVVVVMPDRDRTQQVELAAIKRAPATRTPPRRADATRTPPKRDQSTPRPPTSSPANPAPPIKRGDPGNPYQ